MALLVDLILVHEVIVVLSLNLIQVV